MRRAFFLWGLLSLAVAAEELTLVQFSDVHSGGPYYSAEAFREACQQGLALKPQAVFLGGDHGDNSHDGSSFDERLRQDVGRWKDVLANYPGEVFLATGNDDYGHNYQSQPDELRATARAFQEAFGSRCYLNELGNGQSPSSLGGFRWITLNSQIFSPVNQTPQAPDQAQATLDWLQSVLNQGQGPVVLLCHIPPSWDLYMGMPGWRPQYLRKLADILDNYPGQVIFLCGHLHRNHVQAMRPERPVPILTSGALATKYGYLSNWRDYRWEVEPKVGLRSLSYTVHYTQHPDWSVNYDLRPDRMQDFLDRLHDQMKFYRDYVRDIYGHHPDWPKWAEDDLIRQRILEEYWVDPEAEEG